MAPAMLENGVTQKVNVFVGLGSLFHPKWSKNESSKNQVGQVLIKSCDVRSGQVRSRQEKVRSGGGHVT